MCLIVMNIMSNTFVLFSILLCLNSFSCLHGFWLSYALVSGYINYLCVFKPSVHSVSSASGIVNVWLWMIFCEILLCFKTATCCRIALAPLIEHVLCPVSSICALFPASTAWHFCDLSVFVICNVSGSIQYSSSQ